MPKRTEGKRLTKRVRTVEYYPDWGWIARSPFTGKEIVPDFYWRTRSVARCVVDEERFLTPAGRTALKTGASE